MKTDCSLEECTQQIPDNEFAKIRVSPVVVFK